jgi:hypothetical protein
VKNDDGDDDDDDGDVNAKSLGPGIPWLYKSLLAETQACASHGGMI